LHLEQSRLSGIPIIHLERRVWQRDYANHATRWQHVVTAPEPLFRIMLRRRELHGTYQCSVTRRPKSSGVPHEVLDLHEKSADQIGNCPNAGI